MLTLLVGTPGSGKTLYAIDKIIKINCFEAPEFNHIQVIYNNISGFKFEKYLDSKVLNLKLDFNNFYIHLKFLYSLFLKNQNNDDLDEILKKYCIENNIYNAYFIIDEAHNFFDNQDKIKNWWFTYHRHLNHEILLITQNKTLINTQYRNIPELFIKAQPRSKAISTNVLRYFNYTDYKMLQKFSITEIKTDLSYFDLYTSGNLSKQKLQGKKLLIFFFSMIVLAIILFFYLIYTFFFTPTDPVQESKPVSNIENNNIKNPAPTNKEPLINKDFELPKPELKMFKFTCFSQNCYLKIDNKLHFIPYDILRNFTMNGENITLQQKNKRLNVFLLLPENTFNFLKGVQNENSFRKNDNIDFNINKIDSGGTVRN